MSVSEGFVTHVTDLLAGLGQISARRMFGGVGLYCDGFIFAFLDEDVLHLKTDEAGRTAFTDEGLGPFTFKAKDGEVIEAHAYYRAPERLLDDAEEMRGWAMRAVAVSREAAIKAGKARKPDKTKATGKGKPKGKRPEAQGKTSPGRRAGKT